jgi:polar amino acid transport system substrate-binding protein
VCGKYKDDIVSLFPKATIDQNISTEIKHRNIDSLPNDKITFVHEYDPEQNKGKILGDIKDILKRGELIVCAKKDDNNIFFQMKTEDGRYVGKDIDFAKQIAAALGVRLTYRMVYETHDAVVDAIANGEGDMGIADLSYTKSRSRKALYSVPYAIPKKMMLIDRVFLEKQEGKTLTHLLNSDEITICAPEHTSYETFVNTIFPKAKLLSLQNWEHNIIELIKNKKIIATMRDDIRIKFLIKKYPDILITAMPIILKSEEDPISAVVNFNSASFLIWINKFIENEAKTDAADAIVEKYGDYVK